ncbi:hypothetical protein DL89DRAFT_46375 [Linderina pennispora]|uniref:Uncharacterized protein n=1 Tax=Linderina pennispora TaxID=61395 RepID=A0A1Y1W1X8_9FUNG|nr:uncharacterized protein DL89DRAFT_46375 [Linderina pennispora]ORX67549.1 hypothetical protein DL89DRAFT_46375 [Linderina pennispora]
MSPEAPSFLAGFEWKANAMLHRAENKHVWKKDIPPPFHKSLPRHRQAYSERRLAKTTQSLFGPLFWKPVEIICASERGDGEGIDIQTTITRRTPRFTNVDGPAAGNPRRGGGRRLVGQHYLSRSEIVLKLEHCLAGFVRFSSLQALAPTPFLSFATLSSSPSASFA